MNNFIPWIPVLLVFLLPISWAQCGVTISCSPDQTFTTPGAPQISNIQSAPTSGDAVISWTTDIDANALLEYGTSSSYGSQRTDPLYSTPNHSLTLLSLNASTAYYFRITACNNTGLCSTTAENSFTTSASRRRRWRWRRWWWRISRRWRRWRNASRANVRRLRCFVESRLRSGILLPDSLPGQLLRWNQSGGVRCNAGVEFLRSEFQYRRLLAATVRSERSLRDPMR